MNFAKNIDLQKFQPQETKKQKTVSIFQDFSKWSALNFAKNVLQDDDEEDDIRILANDENSNQNMPCQNPGPSTNFKVKEEKSANNNDQDGFQNPSPSTSKYGQGGFQLNDDDLEILEHKVNNFIFL